MWVVHDRARTDAVHMAFARALQAKTAAYMRYSIAECVKVRELARTMQLPLMEVIWNPCYQSLCYSQQNLTEPADG